MLMNYSSIISRSTKNRNVITARTMYKIKIIPNIHKMLTLLVQPAVILSVLVVAEVIVVCTNSVDGYPVVVLSGPKNDSIRTACIYSSSITGFDVNSTYYNGIPLMSAVFLCRFYVLMPSDKMSTESALCMSLCTVIVLAILK